MPALDADTRDALLNEFALRCFRDVADGDYIAARMAYRAEIFLQAYWATQQALEKYLKAILLLHRIPQTKATHSLDVLLQKTEKQFPLKLMKSTREFMAFIDSWNVDRYFIYPYGSNGVEIIELDRAVWDIRRYCISYHRGSSSKQRRQEEFDLAHIENAVNHAPQRYRSLSQGFLDKVLREKNNSARQALIWNNMFFGASRRKSVRMRQLFSSHNSPLVLYPQIFDEVRKLVFFPKSVTDAYAP
jgi:HEPN domain-containing protein